MTTNFVPFTAYAVTTFATVGYGADSSMPSSRGTESTSSCHAKLSKTAETITTATNATTPSSKTNRQRKALAMIGQPSQHNLKTPHESTPKKVDPQHGCSMRNIPPLGGKSL